MPEFKPFKTLNTFKTCRIFLLIFLVTAMAYTAVVFALQDQPEDTQEQVQDIVEMAIGMHSF